MKTVNHLRRATEREVRFDRIAKFVFLITAIGTAVAMLHNII